MYTNSLNLYPITLGKLSIKDLSNGKYFICDRKARKDLIANKDLVDILKECNGQNSVQDIVFKISKKEKNFEHILRKTKETLLRLNSDKIIVFNKQKGTVPIRIRKNNLNYPLNSVYLELTRRCNFRCVHCYASSPTVTKFEKTKDMTKEEYFKLIDNLDKIGVMIIYLTGGEPFLREDTIDILKYINFKNIKFGILSNSSLLNDKIINELTTLDPGFISISFDDYREGNFEKIRGQGTYKKVLQNIRKLINVGLELQINSVLFKGINDSYKDIKHFMTFFKDEGIDSNNIAFDEFIPQGEGEDKKFYLINENTAIESLKRAYKEVFSIDVDIMNTSIKSKTSDTFCGVGEEICYINSNGNVTLCPGLSEEKYKIGNILKENIVDIWENSDSEILNYFRNKKYLEDSKCLKCKSLSKCFGGCNVRSMILFGKFNAPDPWMCAYLNENKTKSEKCVEKPILRAQK